MISASSVAIAFPHPLFPFPSRGQVSAQRLTREAEENTGH